MAERADPLGLRATEDNHIAPGSALNRHDQVAQAAATTTALIAHNDDQQTGSDEPDSERCKREEHVMQKERRGGTESLKRGRGRRVETNQNDLQSRHQDNAEQKLGREIEPVLHSSI